MKALTVRQPWAWLIFHGKDVENRNWPTFFRGPVAIHAAKGMTRAEYENAKEFVENFDPGLAKDMPDMRDLVRGAIIGMVRLHACTGKSYSPWFQGPYGFMLCDPKPQDPVAARGALGFWDWNCCNDCGVTIPTGDELCGACHKKQLDEEQFDDRAHRCPPRE